ncbi:MAG: histidine kinase [Clostridium sp.]|uniref:LytS/YhcK type 5TM receptor domain-containing protein n=1 Tax=Clostridium sp. TaxID=1506 RepID=UPI0025C6DC3D|nr:LytS/YhcK type 5TM receptor domain-containing protein [Clostridium sp.]MCH3966017.1 histidine kinase [Clostridium sp.]MCI1715895.1 histidine kinase [Clostridium sp.]MCI1800433.1 histidine kinase [Clostridium sp.]MCI1814072.1 histidine kinase [Clostridium sp.]MCI1870970.1 histidine kinase [Clostridium sp.]
MIYVQLLESMSLIALAAYMYNQTRFFRNLISRDEIQITDKFLLVLFFSALGIIGNYTGINVQAHVISNINHNIGFNDAIANTRPIAAVVAGYIGGPLVGVSVGIVSGLNRYFLGGFTAFACAIATISEGLIGAAVRKYSKDGDFKVKHIFAGTVAAEIIQMAIILIFSRPFDEAFKLVCTIALPMILINSFGAAIFVNIIKNARESYNRIGAIHAQKALSIAQKTVNYMRRGLNPETARNVSQIIYEMSDIEGVFIGDKNNLLAYSGTKLDKIELNCKLKNYYLNPHCEIMEISNKGEKLFFICMPFNVRNSGFEGMLGLGVKSKKHLNVYFKQFVEELSDLLSNQIELYKLNKLAQEASTAKFKALRAQIEPHFLFNALNTIASLCRTNPLKARELIVDLSNYFRQTLKKQEEFVTLGDEIEFIKSYLSIEEARFGDRLRLIINIPDFLMDKRVPVFVLQPIVENAVKHGILPKAEGGSIFLKAVLVQGKNSNILFSIEDTGVGMDSDRLNYVTSKWPGIGLKNVNERLKLLYGEDYGIDIETSPHKGTKISFIIPIKEAFTLNG